MTREVKRQKLLVEKAMLEKTLRLIQDEKHEDYLSRLVPIEDERSRLIANAETMAAHLVTSADVIFAYESEEAEKEYEMSCLKLKQDMLEEIRLEMERVKEQKKAGFGSYNKAALALHQRQANMRKTRAQASKKSNNGLTSFGFNEEWARPAAKRLTTVFKPLHKVLTTSEISDDVQEIEDAEREAGMPSELPEHMCIPARFVHGKVLYKDLVLQEDDHIRVTKPPDSITYKAIVCDLTSAEIFLLKENGKYTRLLVQDLRNGSVVVEAVEHDGDE
ncbi:hypothetical protein LEN26_020922 [Aphanomyces euteiches]|nr:hypothetical protein LEN26_020922 [Aphanomyces euteiches]KAH9107586.1 hypothetical protein AeMF1_017108 [Aphanomyces euteiches]KAH9190032.1 hypothetical protein AeNC1_007987 [Aphanomyces euteiches]